MNTLNIGLIGCGTIGRGVAELLQKNKTLIQSRTGLELKLVKIADLDQRRKKLFPKIPFTTNSNDILQDLNIDIVIELIGGVKPAKQIIETALKYGKYVVTANKELIAKHGYTLFQCADENEVDLYYEAAVGGGIPIIRTLKSGLAANNIQKIFGIVNGTTNYILTRMRDEELSYQNVLADAQQLGYAEANPAADIEGHDARYKLAILASIAFQTRITIEQISCQGISRITLEDIAYAQELGYQIKLLAIGNKGSKGIHLKVHPTMLSKEHPLAKVDGVFNAIYAEGDFVGPIMLWGKGAGAHPTASAVVSDLMDIAHDFGKPVSRRNLNADYIDTPILPADEAESMFYLRLEVFDRWGVLAKISSILAKHKVSISKVIQKEAVKNKATLVIVTHLCPEKNLKRAVAVLAKLKDVYKVNNVIHVGI